MAETLSRRTALVTGAGRGIGRAAALALAEAGLHVILAARTSAEIESAAEECRKRGGSARAYQLDVGRWDQVEALARELTSDTGGVDVLVNAAGVYGPIGATQSVDVDAWMQAIHVNLNGAFLLCRAFSGRMAKRRWGKIVLLGGGGAAAPLPFFSAYAASKAGVARLADTLAEELKPSNVQVNLVAPGLIDTQLQDEVLTAGEAAGPLYAKIRDLRASGKGGVTVDVPAKLIVFLASDASGALTGKLISAPHDPWINWGAEAERLNASALYSIRRIDPFTVRPLLADLS